MIVVARVVYLSFILLSALGNAVHSYPDPVGMGIASLLPIALALGMSLIERYPVNLSTGIGIARAAATGVVALGTGIASFLHLYGLAIEHGEPRIVAILTPLAFDGIVLVASLTIMSAAHVPAPAPVPASPPAGIGWVRVPAGTCTLRIIPAVVPAPPRRPRPPRRRVPAPAKTGPTGIVPATPDTIGDQVPGLDDAAILRERWGMDDLPPQKHLKAALGWGSTRVSQAVKALTSPGAAA